MSERSGDQAERLCHSWTILIHSSLLSFSSLHVYDVCPWLSSQAIFIQAAFTAYQDFQSSKVMESLRKLVPSTVRIRRSGTVQVHCAEEVGLFLSSLFCLPVSIDIFSCFCALCLLQLVVGDVVEFSAGDKIAADLRVLMASQVSMHNSFLVPLSVSRCLSEVREEKLQERPVKVLCRVVPVLC